VSGSGPTLYDRWYILPRAGDGTRMFETFDESDYTRGEYRPKYVEGAGFHGWAGTTASKATVGQHYAGLVAQYPDPPEWYIARVTGEWSALNGLSVKGDTRNLATNAQDVAAVLAQRLPGRDWASADLSRAFYGGLHARP